MPTASASPVHGSHGGTSKRIRKTVPNIVVRFEAASAVYASESWCPESICIQLLFHPYVETSDIIIPDRSSINQMFKQFNAKKEKDIFLVKYSVPCSRINNVQ